MRGFRLKRAVPADEQWLCSLLNRLGETSETRFELFGRDGIHWKSGWEQVDLSYLESLSPLPSQAIRPAMNARQSSRSRKPHHSKFILVFSCGLPSNEEER